MNIAQARESIRDVFTQSFDKEKYRRIAKKDKVVGVEFKAKKINTLDFAKKLMGQIVFLYFIQKKGWLGVKKGENWGTGSQGFLRRLFQGKYAAYNNFFNDILEHLFYDTLASDRGHEAWCKHFKCRIPFLNGGLFEPLDDYEWQKTEIIIPDHLFSNDDKSKQGDTGTGILDVFDRYNFTVNESEPLEKEVAIDPEMLGKVFEELLGVSERKSKGSFYTPREIVHYMCQESLVNYLDTAIKTQNTSSVPRTDVETLIHLGERASDFEAARKAGTKSYSAELPKAIEKNARLIDEKLRDITVCDPAIGSGAFPVGMMTEIVRARSTLTPYFNDTAERTPYHFKRHAIQDCLYGVDIDPGAVEIAKLRLWLSLVVDEKDVKQIKPLPNLDYKIVAGNSLLGVEKDLFNLDAYNQLEKLKPRFFDETDHDKKAEIKADIDALIHELTHGKDVFDFEIYFSEVFHKQGGFDVVIANPPYVQFQKLALKLREALRKHKFYESQSDLWYFFVYKAYELLHSKGKITFIVSNYFLQAGHAGTLRDFITKYTRLLSIVNFTGQYVFDNVGVHSALLFLTKQLSEDYVFSYVLCEDPCKLHTEKSVACEINKSSMGKTWKLVSGNESRLLDMLLDQGQQLGSIAKISNGIKSGDDKIFVIKVDDQCNVEKGILKDYLKNSDIHKYRIDTPSRKLIYATSNTPINAFPLFRKYISKHKECLVEKWQKRGESNQYWKLYRAREDMYGSGQELIVTPYRTQEFGFAFNKSCFSGTDTYLILNNHTHLIDNKALLGILNSRLMLWIYLKIGKKKGNIFEIATKDLSLLPIAFPCDTKNNIVDFVNDILNITKDKDYLETPSKQAKTREIEKKIDQLVYELYGLTKEEIAIVESGA